MAKPAPVTSRSVSKHTRGPASLIVNSVEKALRVLHSFDGARPELTLSQIVDRTGLDMSAAQRFTYTLCHLGYLRKDEATRLYALTPRTLEFAHHYVQSSELIKRALPYLLHLHSTFQETTNLTVLDGNEIVFISRFLSRSVFNVDVVVGTRLPAFCTAPGLAMLAQMNPTRAESVLRHSERPAFTSNTVTSVDRIMARLSEIRKTGYAIVCEEMFVGDISVAAAVVDPKGDPQAAVNVAVPTSRWKSSDAEGKFASTVIAAANAICR